MDRWSKRHVAATGVSDGQRICQATATCERSRCDQFGVVRSCSRLGAVGLGLKAHHTLCHFDPGHHVSLCNAWAQILFFSLSVGLTEGTQAASMRLAAAATDHQPRGKKLKPLAPEFKSVHRVTCLEGSFPPLPSKFSHAWKVPPHCRVIPPISCFPIASRVIRAPRQGEVDARDNVTSYFQSSSSAWRSPSPCFAYDIGWSLCNCLEPQRNDNALMGKQTLHSVGSLQFPTASIEQVFVHKG